MSNTINTNEVTIGTGASFREGKVFDAILKIMENLNVPKNGVELDKETGEIKYRYIQIGDLREALQPLLISNKCFIRKIGSKNVRDRRQNKYGTWMNIDVCESRYIIQSLEDGSFITATGRGEGTDWGSSAVTLANADAFKDFIGTTFCLVTDDENSEEIPTPEKKSRKKKAKSEKEVSEVEKTEETVNSQNEEVAEQKIVPTINITAPEPINPILNDVENSVDINECGTEVELPEQAYEENAEFSKPITAEPIEAVEKKEPEPLKEQEELEVETQEVEEATPEVEPTEEQLNADDELKKYASVICPVANPDLRGMPFERVCEMAISNSNETEVVARNCLLYVAAHPDSFNKKSPEFTQACILAVEKFKLAS